MFLGSALPHLSGEDYWILEEDPRLVLLLLLFLLLLPSLQQAQDHSGHSRTSTASATSQRALPGLNSK